MIGEIIIAIQTFLAVYVLYLLILYKRKYVEIIFYSFILILFILLKFKIIYFEPYSILDYLVWGIYNSLLYLFIIGFLIKNVGNTNSPIL